MKYILVILLFIFVTYIVGVFVKEKLSNNFIEKQFKEKLAKLNYNFDCENYSYIVDNINDTTWLYSFDKNKYLKALLLSDNSIEEKFDSLISLKLIVISENQNKTGELCQEENFYIDSEVPDFILSLVKQEINNKCEEMIYLVQRIIKIINHGYCFDVQNGSQVMKEAYKLCAAKTKYFEENLIEEEKTKYIKRALRILKLEKTLVCIKTFEEIKTIKEKEWQRKNKNVEKLKIKLDEEKQKIEEYKKELKQQYHELIKINNEKTNQKIIDIEEERNRLNKIEKELIEIKSLAKYKVEKYKNEVLNYIEIIKTESNLKIVPYFAGIIADIETIILEKAAEALEWGKSKERKIKVESLRILRSETKKQLEEARIGYYQLKYLLELFPALQDFLDEEYSEVKMDLTMYEKLTQDPVFQFLNKNEWHNLSEAERNQLALDRYIESHKKNNWQIGRDYELFVGQKYLSKGYDVDFTGSYLGLEDMGRDLICKKGNEVIIIQCKYWSLKKEIHEKHINQLYGTIVSYSIENNIPLNNVKGCFITNTKFSKTAIEFAKRLNIEVKENENIINFPRIKCNVGVDQDGKKTKIYHLPMDYSYDVAKIVKKDEFFAMTVKDAEDAGFRRSYRWHGDNENN